MRVCVRMCVCMYVCVSVRACVKANLRYAETMGWRKRREMRWVCGEEDTWDRGTLPHPELPPPPVAMQLRAQAEDATARLLLRCTAGGKSCRGVGWGGGLGGGGGGG